MNLNRSIGNILNVLNQAGDRTITIFGDYCLDKYLYIDSARNEPSVETGLTAYQVVKKGLYPGVGGTVANNLRALGAQVICVGLVGEDGEGFELIEGLKLIGAETRWLVRSKSIVTNTYIKPMVGSDHEMYTEINRIDIRNFEETSEELEELLLESLEQALKVSQGVVVTDQFLERNYSAVTDRIRNELIRMSVSYPDKFFYVDSRGFPDCYQKVIVKCNQFELPKVAEYSGEEDGDAILLGGKELLSINGHAVVVTLGADGSYVFEGDKVTHVPAFAAPGPLDIVGAGDATNAGVILGLTLGLTLPEAVMLGGCISSITIQQLGVTGTATIDQVRQRLNNFIAKELKNE